MFEDEERVSLQTFFRQRLLFDFPIVLAVLNFTGKRHERLMLIFCLAEAHHTFNGQNEKIDAIFLAANNERKTSTSSRANAKTASR